MRQGIGIAVLVGALAASFALGRAQAQDEKKRSGGMPDMEASMELAKPGPEHAEFKKLAGEWTCEVKSWMAPGAEPTVEKGKTSYSTVLGGLILKQDYKGSMGGMPFTGIGYTAFNKATGKYEAVWMDSMSSGIMFMNGTEKEKGKTWEYRGHWFGPGGVKVNSRSVMTRVSDDKQTLVMYMDGGQGEKKSAEMTYTRVK